ncbi:hypothetical protein ACFWYW_12320 [Nonomuraea sp. NPDC059023]|uniref:hypothetical protein n=1 Tax=unclassified Nonomuraea TaxID=2593643 RepID=UPI0036CAA479
MDIAAFVVSERGDDVGRVFCRYGGGVVGVQVEPVEERLVEHPAGLLVGHGVQLMRVRQKVQDHAEGGMAVRELRVVGASEPGFRAGALVAEVA